MSTPLSKLCITSATPCDVSREGGAMLTDYSSAPSALTHHRNIAFGGYLDGFAAWLADQGYKGEKIRVAIQNVTALAPSQPPTATLHTGFATARS
jgi:hypothetical protein